MNRKFLTLKDLNGIATRVNKRLKQRCRELGLEEVSVITPLMVRFVVEDLARTHPNDQVKTLVIDQNLPAAELNKLIQVWWND